MEEKGITLDALLLMTKICLHTPSFECHENAYLLWRGLKKRGYPVELAHGIYSAGTLGIKHSWVKAEGMILETDPRQLGIECDVPLAVIVDEAAKARYVECQIDFSMDPRVEEYLGLVEEEQGI